MNLFFFYQQSFEQQSSQKQVLMIQEELKAYIPKSYGKASKDQLQDKSLRSQIFDKSLNLSFDVKINDFITKRKQNQQQNQRSNFNNIKSIVSTSKPTMRERRPMRSSPRRQMINEELDQHTLRMKQLLKADISMLEEQNALLKTKCKKLSELEDKVELVLRQNNQLLGQNQKMSRLLHQHKSQNEILKNKLDQQGSQRIGIMSEFEFKQKKLLNQIQNLHSQLSQLQNVKNLQINQVRTQCQVQLQNLKRQHGNSMDVYEQQIRKLKEILDRRQMQIAELSNRIKKQSSQLEYDLMKGKEEREKLRSEIVFIQEDHKKEVEELRSRLDAHYLEEIDRLKRAHAGSLDIVEKENSKLKDLVDRLSLDCETMKIELDKNTAYYQDTISLLKREIDQLKIQLIELEKISQHQKVDIEHDLARVHQRQLYQLKHLHQDHLRKLQSEIISLQNTNQAKGNQIEQLIREKATARSVFDNETYRLKDEINGYKDKVAELDSIYTTKIKSLDNKIQEKDKQIVYLEQLYRDMKSNSDSQISSLKQLLSQKKIQLEKLKITSKEAEQAALQQKNNLQNQKELLKEALKRQEKEKQILKENLEGTLNQTELSLRAKIESLISKINMIQKENDGLKKNILLKDKEIKGLVERLNEGQARQGKLQHEINQYREKLLQKDRKNNQALQNQKIRLQKSHAYIVENLKSDYEAAARLEAAKLKELKDKLAKKDKQLENLLKMHKKMCEEVKGLTEQEANKKNIDLKFPGATADLIATKNMFDVFLKTKVLDVCGDVIGKENLPEEH